MGRVHLEAVRRLGFVEVAAIAGRRIDAARSMADAFHVERVESHYDRILADPEIQAIHICTPNSLHAPIAKAALAAGKHVLCEKPLAMSSRGSSGNRDAGSREESAELHLSQSALLPDGSADAQHARSRGPRRDSRGAGDVFAGLASSRHRLELADRVRQERSVARDGRHRIALVRHGRTRDRTADQFALRRSSDVSQNAQAAEGFRGNVCGKDAVARGLRPRAHRHGRFRIGDFPHGRARARRVHGESGFGRHARIA